MESPRHSVPERSSPIWSLIEKGPGLCLPSFFSSDASHPRYKGKFPGARNEKGYRADSFEVRGDFNIAYFGDSWVEGHGAARGEIFPDRVSKLLGQRTGLVVKSWNFGLSGTGLDYILRLAPAVCDHLQPDLAIVVFTQVNRREYFSTDGKRMMLRMRQFINAVKNRAKYDPFDYLILQHFAAMDNPYENIAHTVRHVRSLQAVFQASSIPWAFSWADLDDATEPLSFLLEQGMLPQGNFLGEIFERSDEARNSRVHPGVKSHEAFAQTIVKWIQHNKVNLQRASSNPPAPGTDQSSRTALRGKPGVWRVLREMLSRVGQKDFIRRFKRRDPDVETDDIYPLW